MLLVIIAVIIALAFDFTNGFHDTANSIATSISTRALSPKQAVTLSAFMNFIGAFVTLKVAATIGSGVVNPAHITVTLIVAALLGAIVWNLITWGFGMPSSSSHALVGGLIGAGVVSLGWHGIMWSTVFIKIIIPLIFSPIIGFIAAYVVMFIIWLLFRNRPNNNYNFQILQVISAAFVSFSHGSNDAQKTMGVIALILISGGYLAAVPLQIPIWVILLSATAMSLGTYTGGWKIIRTLGTKLYKIETPQGFGAEAVAGTIIQVATHFGLPVSTTHVVTGSILGAGSFPGFTKVKWNIGAQIIFSWIVTIPISAIIAGLLYLILHIFI